MVGKTMEDLCVDTLWRLSRCSGRCSDLRNGQAELLHAAPEIVKILK
jgi:hypothetical protein